jgi:hypothetical protein
VNPTQAEALVRLVTTEWLADPDSSVVWAGEHERRWGIRLRQQAREATTIWFDVGERTVGYEAYLLPDPPRAREDVYRICLSRNHRSWPATISIDGRGDLFVRGRIPLSDLRAERLDEAVGAVYELVEITFHALVRAGHAGREKSR